MRDHSGYIEKDRHEAMQDVLDAWEFTPRAETVAVPDALGRVAAADVVSKNELPNKLTSNMDGIAVYFDGIARHEHLETRQGLAVLQHGHRHAGRFRHGDSHRVGRGVRR